MKFVTISEIWQLLSWFAWIETLDLSERMAHGLRIENDPVWLIFPNRVMHFHLTFTWQ